METVELVILSLPVYSFLRVWKSFFLFIGATLVFDVELIGIRGKGKYANM